MATPSIPPETVRRVDALRAGMNTVPHHEGSNSFSAVFDLFLDLAGDPAFLELGQADDAKDILPMLEMIGPRLFGPQAGKVTLVAGIFVPELGMRHGMLVAGVQPGYFFAFDEDRRGMMGVHSSDGQFQMTRFTMSPLAPGEVPKQLGPTLRGVH